MRFNPLHCGAVVASQLHLHQGVTPPGFNPLHCGAVVASREAAGAVVALPLEFQSPSSRGSGRFDAVLNALR